MTSAGKIKRGLNTFTRQIKFYLLSTLHRDLMLAGTQQSVELKLALDQEQQKSKKLEESMRKLDEEMRRTDELLYQMIPKQVADRLRRGENPIDTCEVKASFLGTASSSYDQFHAFKFFFHRCSIVCPYSSPMWSHSRKSVVALHPWKWCPCLMLCIPYSTL